MNKIKLLVTRKLPDPVVELLQENFAVTWPGDSGQFSREELLEQVKNNDAMLVVGDTVDEAVCAAAAPRCRIFANHGVGYNNIDVAAATRQGIYVSNTPDVVNDATADLAWALLLATARRVVECDRIIRAGKWTSWTPTLMMGTEVNGKTVGIIGGGRIGLAFAKRALGFNMDILYTANSPKPDFEAATGGRFVKLDTLLAEADFITLHVPLNQATRHLIGARELGLMKKTAIIINTSRGPVIDEKALVEALASRQIAGAGLDVFEQEPKVEQGLLTLDNVVMTPHVGTTTLDTRIKMGKMCMRNIQASLRGDLPPNCLNPEAKDNRKE